jgi:hypothetical protein
MIGEHSIELIFFDGCPNVGLARSNLRAALKSVAADITWTEWDLLVDSTPKNPRSYGSPTVLIDGRDVTGGSPGGAAISCRTDGAPSAAQIVEKLG